MSATELWVISLDNNTYTFLLLDKFPITEFNMSFPIAFNDIYGQVSLSAHMFSNKF